jgi:hypothetical protein
MLLLLLLLLALSPAPAAPARCLGPWVHYARTVTTTGDGLDDLAGAAGRFNGNTAHPVARPPADQ